MYALASDTRWAPKWKMEAASTALARPSRTPSTRWSRPPTPPDAITGMLTASATARVSWMSKPALVPSRSMEVNNISPAPYSAMRFAQLTASMPVSLRPPWVNTSKRGPSPWPSPWPARPARLASMATTMHWLPNLSAASRTNSGLRTAAVLMATLSAPASRSFRISSRVLTPPPTVSGMKHSSAVRATTSKMVSRPSWLAVMSRKHNSSAPSES